MEGLIFGILRQLPGVLEIKTTTTNADSFFRLNLNVCINVDNRERARARDKNQRRPISLEEKQKKFIAAVRKRGNISRQQGENERSEKKVNMQNTYISSINRVTGKFLEVSRFIRSKQRQRNVQKSVQSCFLLIRKKCAAGATFFFWLIRPPIFFVCFRL